MRRFLALLLAVPILLAFVYPPPSTETGVGGFLFACKFDHRLQADPIVAPGQVSAHMHDFFGNVSTTGDSTYASMTAAYPARCDLKDDTAGYWAPSLQRSDGTFVTPIRLTMYYRNRPYGYGSTTPFPPDFRMIAGGSNEGFAYPVTWWNCQGESDESLATRRTFIPNCGPTGQLEAHVYFPNCWDGEHTDSPDHRSHVAYAREPTTGVITNLSNTAICPAEYPVKLPQIDFRVLYPAGGSSDYTFSDGTDLMHADFWNTWQQPALERVVSVCLQASRNCGPLIAIP